MKKNYFLYIFIGLTILFGVLVRLSNLDKPTGLWYDEMLLYSVASKHFFSGMIAENTHRFLFFPIYFLVYKFWITLFGNSDFVIRLMSVFFDYLSIASAYFVGMYFAVLINKTDAKHRIGLYNVLLYSINSSFIYYAQEAKFYTMTIFLVNILMIFWLKMLKNPSKLNVMLFLMSNFLLLYSDTLQVLLVIILQVMTFIYLYICRRSEIKQFIGQLFGFFIVLIPLVLIMLINKNYYSGDFNAVVYDNSFILLVIQNWFTPILAGLQNNILSYQYVILSNIFSLKWWIFIFFPIIFYFVLLIKGSKKESISKFLLLIAFVYVLMHIILTWYLDYNVLVRYVMPALPFVLVICAYGVEKINRKRFLVVFIIMNMFAILSPVGATKIERPDGYKDLANILNLNKISPSANFVLPIRVSLLDKYYDIKGKKFSLYSFNAEDCQKTYLTKPELNEIKSKQNLYKNYYCFLTSHTNKDFENYVKSNYINQIPPKSDLVIIVDKSICMFNDEQIIKIANSLDYKKYPLQFLRLSKLNNNLINVLSKNMQMKNHIESKNWSIYIFSKL